MKNIRIMLVAAALASSAISSCSLASEGFKIPTRTNKERVVVGAAIGSSVLMLGGMGLAGKYLTKALDAMTVEQIDNIASGLATLRQFDLSGL
jgi:outer membrane murein-binding lipoprotein Lpp